MPEETHGILDIYSENALTLKSLLSALTVMICRSALYYSQGLWG